MTHPQPGRWEAEKGLSQNACQHPSSFRGIMLTEFSMLKLQEALGLPEAPEFTSQR